MKRSYKLLSIYLDRASLPQTMPMISNRVNLENVPSLSEPYSIFDIPICRRKVRGEWLLSTKNADEIKSKIDKLYKCEEIIIDLDYFSVSLEVNILFIKRVLQIVHLIESQYPQIALTLVANKEQIPEFTSIIHKLYFPNSNI